MPECQRQMLNLRQAGRRSAEHTTPRPFTSPRVPMAPARPLPRDLLRLLSPRFGFGFAFESSSKISFAFSTTLYASRDESDAAPRVLRRRRRLVVTSRRRRLSRRHLEGEASRAAGAGFASAASSPPPMTRPPPASSPPSPSPCVAAAYFRGGRLHERPAGRPRAETWGTRVRPSPEPSTASLVGRGGHRDVERVERVERHLGSRAWCAKHAAVHASGTARGRRRGAMGDAAWAPPREGGEAEAYLLEALDPLRGTRRSSSTSA